MQTGVENGTSHLTLQAATGRSPSVLVGPAVAISIIGGSAIVVTGAISIIIAWTHCVDLHEIAVPIDVDVIANVAFACVEAVGKARPLGL